MSINDEGSADESLRQLLADLFDLFPSMLIPPTEHLTCRDSVQGTEAEEIQNDFENRRWPDLIHYFAKRDPCLTTISFLTGEGLSLTLPSLLVAALLWPESLDVGVLIATLLAPALKVSESGKAERARSGLSLEDQIAMANDKKAMFAKVRARLTPRQRVIVGNVLRYLVQHDPGYPEVYTGIERTKMLEEIERLWC